MFLITVVTIFPEMFDNVFSCGLEGKSVGRLWNLKTVNIRDFAKDKHKTVDDTPCGGGAGMIMKPDIIHSAMNKALSFYDEKPHIMFMTPSGQTFSQSIVKEIMSPIKSGIIILCGRYEGIDQRVVNYWKKEHSMQEISIGDYILFGGEIPAMVIVDSCLRLIPGIMNNDESIQTESFSVDLLEYPQYTKPAIWMEESVPSVLLSGNHKEIAKWRTCESERITRESRPDLWAKYCKD